MGLMPLPTPPEGISLKEYFESWLPEQLGGLESALKETAQDLEFIMGFRAEGEGGGDWTLELSQGKVEVKPGIADNANLTLILAAKDFQDVISGKRPLMPGMGGRKKEGGEGPSPEKAARRMKKMADAVKSVKGQVEFKTLASEGEGFSAKINFGPLQEKPTVSVAISEEDLKAMQKGELNPQAAFMGGKVKIDGDFSFLIQLAPLMMG